MSQTPTMEILLEVEAERARQDEKWGEQNHPDVYPGGAPLEYPEVYNIPSAAEAKEACKSAVKNGTLDFTDIALEEFCEAVEEAAFGNKANLRVELIQCAAVFVAWIEKLDREAAK